MVETRATGHRAWYVRLLLEELDRRGSTERARVLTSPAATQTDSWRHQVEPLLHRHANIDVQETDHALVALARMRKRGRCRIVVPDGDRWLPGLAVLALLRPYIEASVLLIRPAPSWGWRSRMSARVKGVLVRILQARAPGVRVHSLGAVPSSAAVAGTSLVLDPVTYAPATADRHNWLRRHGLDPDRPVTLVIGDVSERKCVAEVADAHAALGASAPVLVVVGRPSKVTAAALDRLSANSGAGAVFRVDGFVDDECFDTWIGSVDAVCLLHRNEGSSGVLLKAWAAGTPVVAGGAQSLVDAVRELDVSAVFSDDLSVGSISMALAAVKTRLRSPWTDTDRGDTRLRAFTTALLGAK